MSGMTKHPNQPGFTLVELSMTMTISLILLLTMAVILVLSRRQTDSMNQRLTLLRDEMILDRWVQHYMEPAVRDSIQIFSNVTNENNDVDTDDGTIVHLFLPDSTQIRLALADQQIDWRVNLVDNHPLDSPASRIRLRRIAGQIAGIHLEVTLTNSEDSLNYARFIVPRN
ncbi:MAG TPA: hypothetical protein DHU63_06055 [Candidatus Marinimicrobia bacterium]|nr:MAG: hypothetical protein AUJ47_05765 [Candidatus Marinimicrobia bacterium CG1_02_48_14]PJA53199.1 MAG: hypothetical protein CO167_07885 [Candidatus Marinimicrobia bacterium CG_4_9_14_3_um_filter_48_9]HCW76086.1 hypothetical protein [Candidatus Neomarinimicrobiota bacterium]